MTENRNFNADMHVLRIGYIHCMHDVKIGILTFSEGTDIITSNHASYRTVRRAYTGPRHYIIIGAFRMSQDTVKNSPA